MSMRPVRSGSCPLRIVAIPEVIVAPLPHHSEYRVRLSQNGRTRRQRSRFLGSTHPPGLGSQSPPARPGVARGPIELSLTRPEPAEILNTLFAFRSPRGRSRPVTEVD